MDIKSNLSGKYFTLYFYLVIFLLPLVFIQRCEDAYYLPKFVLLAGCMQFFVPVLFNLKELKLNLPDYTAFAFLVLFTAGIIFAPYKIQAFMRLAEWVGVLGVFFYARHFLNPRDIRRAVFLMICSSFFVALYALLQVLNFDLSGWITDFSGRAFSSLGNPDFLGGFLAITAPLAVYLSREMNKDKASVFLFTFLSITLFLSQTRSSIAAYAASLILMLFLFFGYFRKNFIYLLAGLGIAILMITATGRGHGLISRFSAASASANPDLSGRFDMWNTGWNMIKAMPFTGTGAGSVKNAYCLYAKAAPYLETDHLHNDFIEIAAESGIFVWFAFMAFLISVFYGLIRKRDTLPRIAAVSLTAMCVQAVFNFPFFIIDTKLYFFAIAGIGLNKSAENKTGRHQAFTAGLIFMIMSVISLRMLAGSMYLNAGINSMPAKNNPAIVYNLERAERFYFDAKPYYYFSSFLSGLGQPADAVLSAKKYMAESPCSKNGFMQYSINMAETGNMQEALTAMDKFLKMYPPDKDALNNKGKMLYMSGRTAEALEIYSRMAAMYPDDETAHNNLYGIYFNGKMNKEAEAEKKRWRRQKGN